MTDACGGRRPTGGTPGGSVAHVEKAANASVTAVTSTTVQNSVSSAST